MKRIYRNQLLKVFIFSLLIFSCIKGQSQSACDFTSLLESQCNFDRLYEKPGYRTGMASSYDRTLGNNDATGYISQENGRYLIADLKGPGAVMRLWSANPFGEIWIYLDDSKEPVIHKGFREMFLGGFPPFTGPFAGVQRKEEVNGYHWAYIPTPFARSCRIYRDKLSFFQASYVFLPVRR